VPVRIGRGRGGDRQMGELASSTTSLPATTERTGPTSLIGH
jgi:hypothetical protein